MDVAIQYEEFLKDGKIEFIPKLKEMGNLDSYFGHREIKIDKKVIKVEKSDENIVSEIVVVKNNYELLPINLTYI